MTQRTLAIISPTRRQGRGRAILARSSRRASRCSPPSSSAVVRRRRGLLRRPPAAPVLQDLCTFMTEGPCIPLVLEAETTPSRTGATSWAPPIRQAAAARSARSSRHRSRHASRSDAPETRRSRSRYFFSAAGDSFLKWGAPNGRQLIGGPRHGPPNPPPRSAPAKPWRSSITAAFGGPATPGALDNSRRSEARQPGRSSITAGVRRPGSRGAPR